MANKKLAEKILTDTLEDIARVELLRAEKYEYLLPEWNPEKENKSKEELIQFANGRIAGHWQALQHACDIPWEELRPTQIGQTRLQYNLKLLEKVREGKFDREIRLSEESRSDIESTRAKLRFNKKVACARYGKPWSEIKDLFLTGQYEELEKNYSEDWDITDLEEYEDRI